MALNTKKCHKCGENKLLTLKFWYKNTNSIDGFNSVCKICQYKVLRGIALVNQKRNKQKLLEGKLENSNIKKVCRRCKELKPLTFEFWNKDINSKDGFVAHCRICDKKRFNKIYNRNKKNINKRNKEIPSYVFTHVKSIAIKRNLKFEIDLEYYKKNLFKKPCYYCGGKTKGWLDRKNNDKNIGYTIDNAVSCCENCNKAKGVMTVDEFLTHILKIAEYTKKIYKSKYETNNTSAC